MRSPTAASPVVPPWSAGRGCGKTLLAMEFLVRGATQYNEPGVFIAFEETADELVQNMSLAGL